MRALPLLLPVPSGQVMGNLYTSFVNMVHIRRSLMYLISLDYVRLATGWTVQGSNPGGGKIFRTYPDRPWGPPSLLYNE
jgi:hypothetical protein